MIYHQDTKAQRFTKKFFRVGGFPAYPKEFSFVILGVLVSLW
jgi:hypothetical protein